MFSELQSIPAPPRQYKTALKKRQEKMYIEFGNILISRKQLERHKLLVSYPSGGPVKGVGKALLISDTLLQILVGILTTSRIDTELQSNLNDAETKILNTLMTASRLKQVLQYKQHVKTLEDHLRRFDVLRGGLNAGLHAPEVLKELNELTHLLSSPIINRISEPDAIWIQELLKDLGKN